MAFDWNQYLEMNPSSLGWGNFTTVPNMIHGQYEAEAGFNAHTTGGFSYNKVGGLYQMVLDDDFRVVIVHWAEVWKEAKKTKALLDHEDIHYQFARVHTRAMLIAMDALRKKKTNDFKDTIHDMTQKHLVRRVDALNKKYDAETDHSKNTEPQRRWQKAVDECLADDTATTLMGLPL